MNTQSEPVIACALSDPEERRAREAEVGDLFQTCQAISELPDGYQLCFSGTDETLAQLSAFLRAERRCCPFFTFELALAPNLGPITLSLRGSAAIKEYVRGALLPAVRGADTAATG
jgi:hypothetical protein